VDGVRTGPPCLRTEAWGEKGCARYPPRRRRVALRTGALPALPFPSGLHSSSRRPICTHPPLPSRRLCLPPAGPSQRGPAARLFPEPGVRWQDHLGALHAAISAAHPDLRGPMRKSASAYAQIRLGPSLAPGHPDRVAYLLPPRPPPTPTLFPLSSPCTAFYAGLCAPRL
jgi:hypothetical protein